MSCNSDCECSSLAEIIDEKGLIPILETLSLNKLNVDIYQSLEDITSYQQGIEDGYILFARDLVEALGNG